MLKSLCNIAEGFFMLCKSLKTAAMPSNRAFKAVGRETQLQAFKTHKSSLTVADKGA